MPQMIKKADIEQYIGHVCEPTPWFEVTQEQVNEFAECTLDRQFIHIDPVAAANTPFGGIWWDHSPRVFDIVYAVLFF